jgi:hypothetical protein
MILEILRSDRMTHETMAHGRVNSQGVHGLKFVTWFMGHRYWTKMPSVTHAVGKKR